MISGYIRYAVFLLFLILIGLKFSGLYSIYNIKPDLILIFLIRKSLNEPKPQEMVLWGFFSGMTVDLLIGDVIGITSLSYSVICFFSAFYKRNSIYVPAYKRTTLYILAVSISAFLIYAVTLSGMPFLKNIMSVMIPSAAYTLSVAVVFQTFKPTK